MRRPGPSGSHRATWSRRDRAISTVVDVTMAMLFISAAMIVMAAYLQGGLPGHDPTSADEAAETAAASTISVEYNVSRVQSESNFDETRVEDEDAYERRRHGSIAGLASDAAVTNTTLWGDSISATDRPYEAAVDGAARSQLVGAETQLRVQVVWRPWRDSDVQGVATIGERPPADADVSSVTMTMPSGIDVNESRFRADHGDDRATAKLLGDAIVAHHFPPEESQRALESQGARRQFVVYHYLEFAEAVGVEDQFEPNTYGNFTHRETANATAANEALAEGFADQATSRGAVGGSYSGYDEAQAWMTAEEVHVTVQTWSE